MRRLCFYLCFVLMMINCAGFKNTGSTHGVLSRENVSRIDGSYNNYPVEGDPGYVDGLADIFDRNKDMFTRRNKYDTRAVHFKLKSISEDKMNVKIYRKEELLFDKNMKMKLKNDGFLYLKEKRLMLDGLPLIFGGWNVQKSRFTVDENNRLTVETNYFFCRGAMIIMNDCKTFHYHLTFEKQKP